MIQNGRLVQTRWPGALCGALPSGEDAPADLKTIGTVGRVKPFFDFVEGKMSVFLRLPLADMIFVQNQGGLNRRTGFIDSEGSHR